jgi:hypothetical protein
MIESGTNLAVQELAQLEAERHRLLSMIAYQNRPLFQVPAGRAPAWFVGTAIGIICVIVLSIVAGIFAGQISATDLLFLVLFLVVGLPMLGYILTRKITVFGTDWEVGAILTFNPPRVRQPGELEAQQRLADCEARIAKLKEDHP